MNHIDHRRRYKYTIQVQHCLQDTKLKIKPGKIGLITYKQNKGIGSTNQNPTLYLKGFMLTQNNQAKNGQVRTHFFPTARAAKLKNENII